MTSKEALKEMYHQAEINCDDDYMLGELCKDYCKIEEEPELLHILKIHFNNLRKDKQHRLTFEITYNDTNFNKVKEWLENE